MTFATPMGNRRNQSIAEITGHDIIDNDWLPIMPLLYEIRRAKKNSALTADVAFMNINMEMWRMRNGIYCCPVDKE